MREIGFPDRHYIQAAEGWLELGDSAEAARELRHVSRDAESHPDVLELRWRLAAMACDWHEALDLARAVTRAAPDRASGWIHKSYSLHELKRTQEAQELLIPLAKTFPNNSTIAYNLACYACQLGALAEARDWIQRAFKQKDRRALKQMALNDPDLLPLRDYIETL